MEQKIEHEGLRLRGCIEVYLHDAKTGKVLEQRRVNNIVVTQGRAWVLMRIQGSSADANLLNYIALGTSSSANPATGDTALYAEVTSMRTVVGTWSYGTASNPPYVQGQVSFATNAGNTTLAEAGFFNSSSGGTMLSHVTFSSINKTTSNTLTISYSISN